MTLSENLHNRGMRKNTTFIFNPKESYYLYNGKKISVEDFYKMFPVVNIRGSKENPDKTKLFIID